MARVLIVGCGCRGRTLARALVKSGRAVRGTTRDAAAVGAIQAVGAEPALADPDRLATLLPHIPGVAVACWLLGSAEGEREAVAALHGPRLETILETLVDTHVRGFVYEAVGGVDPTLLERGAAAVRTAGERYRMPVEVVDTAPDDAGRWLDAMTAAVGRVLSA